MLTRYLSDEGDPEKADKLMRSLARPYPDSALATMPWRRWHCALAIPSTRSKRASESIELDPDSLKPKLLYARALAGERRDEKAIEYTARIIGDDPDPDPDARMELAIMYMLVEREDDALSQVNQVLLEQSGRMDALRLMAIIQFSPGTPGRRMGRFQDLLASGQFTMDALYYLGRIADYREETDRAIRFSAKYGRDPMRWSRSDGPRCCTCNERRPERRTAHRSTNLRRHRHPMPSTCLSPRRSCWRPWTNMRRR